MEAGTAVRIFCLYQSLASNWSIISWPIKIAHELVCQRVVCSYKLPRLNNWTGSVTSSILDCRFGVFLSPTLRRHTDIKIVFPQNGGRHKLFTLFIIEVFGSSWKFLETPLPSNNDPSPGHGEYLRPPQWRLSEYVHFPRYIFQEAVKASNNAIRSTGSRSVGKLAPGKRNSREIFTFFYIFFEGFGVSNIPGHWNVYGSVPAGFQQWPAPGSRYCFNPVLD